MAIHRKCNICAMQKPPVDRDATFDAKTYVGPWAYVCDEHLKSHCLPNLSLRTKLSEVG
ncbi:hypothetical protein PBI_TRISCUIT_74 [Microbacterium phage Triscuit]|nr:hypothetical protein PBI_TRISCUIT_74 [Microbacterium phage Triscuit]